MNMTNHVESPYFERLHRSARPALQAAWDKAHSKQFGTLSIYQSFCKDMEEIGHDKPSKPAMSDWIDRVQKGLVVRPGSPADGADPALVADLEAVLAEPIEEIVEPVEEVAEPASVNHAIGGRQGMVFVDEATSYPNPYIPQVKNAEERAHRSSKAPITHPLDHQFNSEVLQLFAEAGDNAPAVENALTEVRENLRKDLRISCLDGIDDLTDEVVSRAQKMARQMMVEILRDLAAEMEAAA